MVGACAAGGLVGWVARGFAISRRAAVSEDDIIEVAGQLNEIEQALWKPAGVGIGYSIDYEVGSADVSIRVPNCGEDVVFHLQRVNVSRRKRPVEEVLGLKEELPPSLRDDSQSHGDN